MGGHRVDARTGQGDGAASLDEAEDAAQRGGLAGAIAAQDGGDAGRGHLEGDVFDDLLPRDGAPQVFDGEDGCGAHAAFPRYACCTTGSAMTFCGVS